LPVEHDVSVLSCA